jgi:selenocysteine lyase/cysteine desulfurase
LYVRESVLDQLGQSPFLDGRSADWTSADTYEYQSGAHRFEFGEQNFAGKAGLGVAIEYALSIGLDTIRDRIASLASRLRSQLGEIEAVTVRYEGTQQSGIVTFTIDGRDPIDVRMALGRKQINVSSPARRNAQFDLGGRGLDSVVRAGVHYFNTFEEVDRLVDAVTTG